MAGYTKVAIQACEIAMDLDHYFNEISQFQLHQVSSRSERKTNCGIGNKKMKWIGLHT